MAEEGQEQKKQKPLTFASKFYAAKRHVSLAWRIHLQENVGTRHVVETVGNENEHLSIWLLTINLDLFRVDLTALA